MDKVSETFNKLIESLGQGQQSTEDFYNVINPPKSIFHSIKDHINNILHSWEDSLITGAKNFIGWINSEYPQSTSVVYKNVETLPIKQEASSHVMKNLKKLAFIIGTAAIILYFLKGDSRPKRKIKQRFWR